MKIKLNNYLLLITSHDNNNLRKKTPQRHHIFSRKSTIDLCPNQNSVKKLDIQARQTQFYQVGKNIEFDAPEKIFLIIFKDMKDDLEREHDDMSVNTDRVVRVDLGHLHGVDHLLYQPHLHNPMQKDIYKNLTTSSHFNNT